MTLVPDGTATRNAATASKEAFALALLALESYFRRSSAYQQHRVMDHAA